MRFRGLNLIMVRHLYFHIPFCTHICPYCGFYKHLMSGAHIHELVDALLYELETQRHLLAPDLLTVFMGGGTPSALSSNWLDYFFENARLAPLKEFTMEVNPATLTQEKCKVLAKAGINRISLGVQSFDPQMLSLLGRKHTPQDVDETLRLLRDRGLTHIGLDLMFALPGQSLESWSNTLDVAISKDCGHISTYNLTFEEDTEFLLKHQRGIFKSDDRLPCEMYELACEKLAKAGYERIELSNFSRPGHECLHNRACWDGCDYLGIGPSACSTVGLSRWKNVSDSREFIRRTKNNESLRCETEDLSSIKTHEKIILGLRTSQGVSLDLLTNKQSALESLLAEGFGTIEDSRFVLNTKGMLVADSISEVLL